MGKVRHKKPLAVGNPPALRAFEGKKLELRDLRLIKSATFLETGISPSDLPKQVDQQTTVQCARGTTEPALIYMLEFSLSSRSESGTPVLSFTAVFGLVYRLDSLDGIDADSAQFFGQTTALFCAWPYWREYVQNMAGRMGLPPIRIPLMRPTDMEFSKKPDQDSDRIKRSRKR